MKKIIRTILDTLISNDEGDDQLDEQEQSEQFKSDGSKPTDGDHNDSRHKRTLRSDIIPRPVCQPRLDGCHSHKPEQSKPAECQFSQCKPLRRRATAACRIQELEHLAQQQQQQQQRHNAQ